MKLLKFGTLLFIAGAMLTMVSCGEGTAESHEGTEETQETSVMTTEEFIAEANKLGRDEFEIKYPDGAEIELEGQVRAPATWNDKIAAKFGTGLNDLPLTADFMFSDNGGTKESTKEKVKGGETVRFKGTKNGSFFMNEKLNRCTFSDCVAQ